MRPLFSLAVLVCTAMAADSPLQPPRVITNPGPEYAGSARQWQGIPSIERAPNGRLWATWYSGGSGEGPDNYVILVTSGDDGKTWSSASLIVEPVHPVRAYDPCLWIDPNGRLWLFWTQAQGWWDGRGGVWGMSRTHPGQAEGRWSEPRRLADGVMMNRPAALSHNRWLFAIGGWRNIKIDTRSAPVPPVALERERGSNAYLSTDRLRTLSFLGQAQVPDASFDESMILERRNKSLWMLVRTKSGVGESTSRDGGKTWSAGVPSQLQHVSSRFHIRRLRSGHLLLIHNLPPDGKTRSHLTASLSLDDGKTWPHHLLLDERKGVSYPDAVEGRDGRIYVIYDRDRNRAGEILMAVFSEAEIRHNSSGARLRQLVSRLDKNTRE